MKTTPGKSLSSEEKAGAIDDSSLQPSPRLLTLRLGLTVALLAGAALGLRELSRSEPSGPDIEVKRPFVFFDIRSPNVGGMGPGEGVVVGAESVLPSGDFDGDGFADSDGVSRPTNGAADQDCIVNRRLLFTPNPKKKNLFSRFTRFAGRPCKPLGAWRLTFENSGRFVTVWTPAPDESARVPLVETLWLRKRASGAEFQWAIPKGSPHTAVVFRLYDLEQRNKGKYARIVFTEKLDADQSTFTVPMDAVQPAHHYAAAVELRTMRDGDILSRSRSLFNFAIGPEAAIEGQVLLPIVDHDGGAPGLAVASYTAAIEGPQPIWIELPLADKVVYANAAESPPVRALQLPAGVKHGFVVHYDKGPAAGILLTAGKELTFPQGSVNRFTLTRLEGSRASDVQKTLSVPLALRFAYGGQLSATMSGRIVPGAWTGGCLRLLKTMAAKELADGALKTPLEKPGLNADAALICGLQARR
jgi:hypothetical protein